jgi:peptide/nickel transport system substrate-binding protein
MTVRLGVIFAAVVLMAGSAGHSATLRLGLEALPPSFGVPYRTAQIPSISTTGAIFDGLTRIDRDGTLRPWLATGWSSIDGVTWRFTLRDGVTFSNGAPFTADAVKVAVDYLSSDDAAKEGLNREIPRLAAARVVDVRTVDIVLAEPDASFPRSATALVVGEPGQWQRLGRDGFGREPVGTGPFALVSWEPNRAVLKAFPGSWRRPKVDALEIVQVPDRAARTQALLADRLDIALGLGVSDMSILEAAGLQAVRIPTAAVAGWSLMLIRDGHKVETPLQDVRVRRAMTMAIDRNAIVAGLLDGNGQVASQPATPATYGYNPDLKPLPYDPDAAKRLLAEAGYPDGFSLTMSSASGPVGADADVAQRAAEDLAKVGIKVEIRGMPLPQYLQHLSRATFPTDIFTGAWPSDPNIDALRSLRIHSCLRREPFYCDEAIMPRIRRALTTMDVDEGLRLRREIMAWYHDQVPGLYFYQGMRFAGLARGVTGFDEVHNLVSYDTIELPETRPR